MTAEIELARPRAASLPDKIRYAQALADSGLLPAQYRGKPANLLYAVEYGEMLGLAPMAAINGVHVIEGKPSASAALISALVRRAGHRLRITGDDQKAVCEIVRADDPDFVFRSEWTMERARGAGIANKQVWKSYPAAMLKARALTECARDACQEALSGLQYTPEELGAETNEDGEPVRVAATAVPADPDWASKPATQHERATGQPEPAGWTDEEWVAAVDAAAAQGDVEALQDLWRKAKAERPTDVELREHIASAATTVKDALRAVETGEPIAADVVGDQPAEQKQHRHMHALWNKAEVSREERLEVTSHLIGRDITTSNELTYADAETVIGQLSGFGDDVAALKSQVVRWLGDYHGAYDEATENGGA